MWGPELPVNHRQLRDSSKSKWCHINLQSRSKLGQKPQDHKGVCLVDGTDSHAHRDQRDIHQVVKMMAPFKALSSSGYSFMSSCSCYSSTLLDEEQAWKQPNGPTVPVAEGTRLRSWISESIIGKVSRCKDNCSPIGWEYLLSFSYSSDTIGCLLASVAPFCAHHLSGNTIPLLYGVLTEERKGTMWVSSPHFLL